jgi:hypothetical protein
MPLEYHVTRDPGLGIRDSQKKSKSPADQTRTVVMGGVPPDAPKTA